MVNSDLGSNCREGPKYHRRQSVDGSDPAYNESAKESLRAGERNVESTTQLEFASAQQRVSAIG